MRAITRFLGRRRRLLAAILAGCSVACALLTVSGSEGVEVLAAARDLPGGRLSMADLTVLRIPSAVLPDGVLEPGTTVAGRVLTGPIRRGEPLTDVRLLGGGLLAGQHPGLVATPVRIADADVAQLVAPGDIIDVLAAPSGAFLSSSDGAIPTAAREQGAPEQSVVADMEFAGATTVLIANGGPVVSRVTVLAATSDDDRSEGALLVLATSQWQAAQLAAAQSGARLSIAIHPR
ncbi:hypothetical protein Aph01nite_68230 [Acrocarpospora phusangensis]|uniref:SAF domain-containing protein n=1 Tax=Acrocarpospora phusangensis TaxID=1070424 RepID=A0A919QIZ1_9ACTN|nr:SAF domain-containing protein [Acrocarpospora phusangensis]GIH28513.1 hypothetical protein Aph01nite_68230 [Acrocarpospora phusangensis]